MEVRQRTGRNEYRFFGVVLFSYIEVKFHIVRLLIANLTDENGTVVRFSGC